MSPPCWKVVVSRSRAKKCACCKTQSPGVGLHANRPGRQEGEARQQGLRYYTSSEPLETVFSRNSMLGNKEIWLGRAKQSDLLSAVL